MIIWYKEATKISTKMAKINIRLCCETKKSSETDLPKVNLKKARGKETNSLNFSTNITTRRRMKQKETEI
jgi:hypothetical protein